MGRTRRKIRAGGDTWSVRLAERPAADGSRVVLFFCVTTDQRPYRVVEVPRERIADEAALERLSDDELGELFAESKSMGFPRDYHRYGSPSS